MDEFEQKQFAELKSQYDSLSKRNELLEKSVQNARYNKKNSTPDNLIPKLGNIPSNTAYYTTTSLIHDKDESSVKDEVTAPISLSDLIEKDGKRTLVGFSKPHKGIKLTHQQTWKAKGIGLGSLVHSLCLAPGEATRVAVQDWTNTQRGQSAESSNQSEAASSANAQSRAIDEVQNSTAREALSGSSNDRALGTSSSAGMSMLFLSAGSARSNTVATSVNTSTGESELLANDSQRIQQATEKAAETARNRRASVVREITQSDTSTTTTRIIANYNHMHALTMMYYEVLEAYEVTTSVINKQNCVFIPMALMSSETLLSKHSNIIANAAQAAGMDLLASAIKLHDAQFLSSENYPNFMNNTQAAEQEIKIAAGTIHTIYPLRVEMYNEDKAQWSATQNEHQRIISSIENNLQSAISGLASFASSDLSEKTKVQIESAINALKTARGDERNQGDDVKSLLGSIKYLQTQEALNVYGVAGKNSLMPYTQSGVASCETTLARISDAIGYLQKTLFSIDAVKSTSEDLIGALDKFNEYFNQAVWLECLTPAVVHAMFEGKVFESCSLNSLVDPKPIAFTGNLVGFALGDSETLKDQSNAYTSTIVMPTGGVFGEAVLGQSIAAEKIDLTRFWNWQDSPIPLTPAEISPQSNAHTVASMDLNARDFSEFKANLEASQAMPNPEGLSAILQSISSGNLFKDMSGQDVAKAMADAVTKYASESNKTAQTLASSNFQKSLDIGEKIATGILSGGSSTLLGGLSEMDDAGVMGKLLGIGEGKETPLATAIENVADTSLATGGALDMTKGETELSAGVNPALGGALDTGKAASGLTDQKKT
ncbi:hypothetical protein [Glaciecola sp. SC05]|uniref:hypothetical protein n=1 Tax=Glaciecola sp. SC05 TaxID=1987355 RepID=UPI00352757A0